MYPVNIPDGVPPNALTVITVVGLQVLLVAATAVAVTAEGSVTVIADVVCKQSLSLRTVTT